MSIIGITRKISPSINKCKLSHIKRVPINYNVAINQHNIYENALRDIGVNVISLPPLDDFPDSVFVEDCAIVFNECAIITRPGDISRVDETKHILDELSKHRKLLNISDPGTLDGGDVMCIGKKIYVGMSNRSNTTALQQLSNLMNMYDYKVIGVSLRECLHLKSAVTYIGRNTVLLNPSWINASIFSDYNIIYIDPTEPHAANALLIKQTKKYGDIIIFPTNYIKTLAKLENNGFNVISVPIDELAKAEGAVTCSSLIIRKVE